MNITKKAFFAAVILFLMTPIFSTPATNTSLPFSKGVNLLKWFEIWEDWDKDELPPLNKYDEDDFACLKDMGIEPLSRLAWMQDVP